VRVLHVVLGLHPGGTERLVIELARRLHADMPAAVCCLDETGAWAGELLNSGIAVTALARKPGFRPGLARRVAAAAVAHGATVLHAHHYSPFVYGALARIVRPGRPGLRLVFTEHGRLSDAGPSRKRRLANRALRRLATRVFAVSEDVRQHLVAEGFGDEDVGVIYNGIEVGPMPDVAARAGVRRELGATADDFVVGTIARLDPVKDLGTLLEAVARLGSGAPSPILAIVGDGAERGTLEARAASLGIASRTRFLGERDDARRWLAGCDVYANSSISEGVSLTILEGMAAGLPVVATRVGGTPEVVTGECGLLVPSRDAGALADALRRLAGDAGLRRELGAAARRRVETRFTLERMVREYRDAYLSVSGIGESENRGIG